jgi:hypothetical protein
MMAFQSWHGIMGVAQPGWHATPTSLDQVVVAKTKHAALFFLFLKSKAFYIYFLSNLICFFQELLKKKH